MSSHQEPARRRWKHRIPVRLRHYWKVPAGLAAVAALLIAFGDARVRPLFIAEPVVQETITDDIENNVHLAARPLLDFSMEKAPPLSGAESGIDFVGLAPVEFGIILYSSRVLHALQHLLD